MSLRELATISALTLLPTPLAIAQTADLGNRDAMPQSQAPAVSAREIVKSSLRFETLFGLFDFGPPPDYLCLVELASRPVDASGQAPHIRDTWEMMSLYGETFERLIRKNGKELAPNKARAEQARFDKAVEKRAHETPEARAKRQKAERKFQAERDACREEFMRSFDFRLAGQEVVGGRQSWVIDASPAPNSKPRCGDLKTLSKFHFKLWIDQTEFGWARFEGDNIAPTSGLFWPGREPAGAMHLTSEQTRYGEGVWLRTRDEDTLNIKVIVSAPVEITITYSGYRKFQADSRILPVDGK
ncbi:MAG TPA: hypothetical protein VGG72_30585 [Bryobacteraceae bacterium]|jgi:hypothetical protein